MIFSSGVMTGEAANFAKKPFKNVKNSSGKTCPMNGIMGVKIFKSGFQRNFALIPQFIHSKFKHC